MAVTARRRWIFGLTAIMVIAAGVFWWWRHPYRISAWTIEERVKSPRTEPGRYRIIRGRFTFRVNMPENAWTTVTYLIPVDGAGKPLAGASDMVFYAPFTGEAWRKPPSRPIHFYFAEELGMSIFSLTIHVDRNKPKESPRHYTASAGGWSEVVWRAQQLIAERHGLDVRPLLAWGQSSGATMAAQLALRFPAKFDAVTGCGGNISELPSADVPAAWLILNTWGCPGIPANREFEQRMLNLGHPCLRGETPPRRGRESFDHHTPNEDAYELIALFLRDAAKLRRENHGLMPPAAQWPETQIIRGRPQWLPSGEFAQAWRRLPHDAMDVTLRKPQNGLIRIDYPLPERISRFAIVVAPENDSNYLRDALYECTQRGAAAVGLLEVDDTKITDWEQALKQILAGETMSQYPVELILAGNPGQKAAVAALKLKNGRIRRINGLDLTYNHVFPELSLEGPAKDSPAKLTIFVSSDDPGGAAIPRSVEVRRLKSRTPERAWPELLNQCFESAQSCRKVSGFSQND